MKLSSKKFSILHILLISVAVSGVTFAAVKFFNKPEETAIANDNYACNYQVTRMSGYSYIKPLLLVDEDCESQQLEGVKQKVNQIIERYKNAGDASSASVYLRTYSNNQWTVINENEEYEPGSLFKVPILIAILKMNEDNPGFLSKKITFTSKLPVDKNVAFTDKTIKSGNSYTVAELLTYMIEYSDNNATSLLIMNMDPLVMKKLFADVGLQMNDIYAQQYFFKIKDYSLFMRVIYNAGYLTIKDSEYAAELLGKSTFKEGITKMLPAGVKVAHKFGESGNQTEKQLHETAIIYLDNKPYLLTVMTKGNDNAKLSALIAEISQTVYTDISNSGNF
ncbi:serine hydrolase [Flavobacterium sp. 3HN19-14]|uniref:serine hydrolase n=1 Tax=Flavobacterium sp. 3HN19-14 TaxID=3448133 RepID=UPI003EE05982